MVRTHNRLPATVFLALVLAGGCSRAARVITPTEVTEDVGEMALQAAVTDAVANLARELDVPAGQVEVIDAESVNWPDASLGAPEPGKMYAQVVTPGYRMELEIDGHSYALHGDRSGRWILAREPSQPAPPAPHSKLRAVLDYLAVSESDLDLAPATDWALEDTSPPGAGGTQTWLWRDGLWSIQITGAAGKATSFGVVLAHEQHGVAWMGRVQSNGHVVPEQEPAPADLQDALHSILTHFDDTYPGFGLMQQPEWSYEDVTPPGSVGSSTALWRGGEWILVMSYPIVPEPDYQVVLTHHSAGTVWSGVLGADGQVISDSPVLLSAAVGACDETLAPDALEEWHGAEFEVRDGLIHFTHKVHYVCCAELALAAGRDGSAIKIVETNVGEVCRCMCGYTITAELTGLQPGTYTVEIWGVQHLRVHPLELLGEQTVTVP